MKSKVLLIETRTAVGNHRPVWKSIALTHLFSIRPAVLFLSIKKGVYFSAAWIVFLTLAAIFCETAPAYDGWGKSIPNITDPGMPARYLWRDAVEDGNKESLLYGYDGDHLAAIVANLNYAAMRNSYATGDFDGNGCQDLAVGTPYATVAGVTAAGRVRVLFYQPVAPPPPPGGITAPGPQQTCKLLREEVYSMAETQDRRTMFGLPDQKFSPQRGGFVGFSMATGDFNCDGVNDLAVGAPGIYYETCDELMPCPRKGGGVFIGYGRPNTGLDFHQEPNSATLSGVFTYWYKTAAPAKFQLHEPNEDGPWVREFALRGYSLASGRFFPAVAGSKCDAGIGLPDLAIGAPGQNLGNHPLGDEKSKPGAGLVTIVRGDPTGLNAASGVINFDESDFGVTPSRGPVFGFSLAAGRFHSTVSGDYHALAIGAPGKDSEKGRVYVVRGGAGGPTIPPGTQKCISQNGGVTCIDINGGTENGDRFGFALAAGDFNGDGFQDLAIGNPGEQLDRDSPGQGAVSLLLGSPIALIAQVENLYAAHPDPNFSLNANRQVGDAVGYALAAGDFDGDGFADLAIGVPGRDVITRDAGAVVIKHGGCQGYPNCAVGNYQGLSANTHVQWIHRSSPNPLNDLDGGPGHNELVGAGLLAADLDRNGRAGLVIGAPGQTIPDPFIAPLVGFGAMNFRTYTAFTYFVPGRPSGLDANFENQTTVPWTDSLNGELAVVIVPKVSNFSIPFGILDLFDQALQKALDNAPKGTEIGEPRFAVIDSLVPHPPAHPSTYTNVAVFDNLIRFEVSVRKGPAKGTVRGYLSARIDTTDNSLVVNAAWEPDDFSAIVMAFFGDQIDGIAGSQFMKIYPSQFGVNVGTLTHVQILPSMELEVGLKP